jgi:hypothetical protein
MFLLHLKNLPCVVLSLHLRLEIKSKCIYMGKFTRAALKQGNPHWYPSQVKQWTKIKLYFNIYDYANKPLSFPLE